MELDPEGWMECDFTNMIHNLTHWQGFQAMVLICSSTLQSFARVKFHLLSEEDDFERNSKVKIGRFKE